MPGPRNDALTRRKGYPPARSPGPLSDNKASSPDGQTLMNGSGSLRSSQHLKGRSSRKGAKPGVDGETHCDLAAMASAATQTTLPAWVNMVVMVSLIFGGCCANVFALEAIVKDEPSSGPLITFVQFVVTALFTLPAFLSFSAGPRSLFLRPRAVPIKSWLIYTAFFMTVNLLNNWAFAYKISVPLHIILRSGGPVSSMAVGYLYNSKRYSRMQVLAVLLLTLGVVGAALADASAKGQSMEIGIGSDEDGSSLITSVTGFMILALAMILASFQGVYADRLYEMYGRSHWREALLYSHMLSLPFFLPTYPHLSSQFRALLSSPPMLSLLSSVVADDELTLANSTSTVFGAVAATTAPVSSETLSTSINSAATSLLLTLSKQPLVRSILARTPVKVAYLLLNAVTQYLCIRGVHLLSANSSSLTVTIVLNIRKLVSLLLSIYLFGNVLATGVLVGAALVFIGGGLYGFEGARLRKRKEARKTE